MPKSQNPVVRLITAPFRFIRWLITAPFKFIRSTSQRVKAFFTEEEEDTPLPDAVAKTIENPMGLMVHIDALRKHLLRCVLAMVVTTALAMIFMHPLLNYLSTPLEGGLESLQAIDVTEPVGTVMKVALLTGFTLAFPYIALEIWMFIAPGVSRRSRMYGLLAIPIATLFFVAGMAFAFYLVLPTALPFLLNFMGINTMPRPSSYIGFLTTLMFWMGVAFEFPLVIYLLAKLGWVKAKFLRQQWRLAIVIIAVAAALITPTVDPVNMSLVMAPLIVLYFLSVGLASLAEAGRL
jgi:sec-independent protein translocase protein TatC